MKNIPPLIRLALCIACVFVLAVWLLPAAAAPPRDPLSKIDPWVLRTTENGARTSFLVVLTTQADTSGAAAFATKAQKGRYVFERLYATAQSTQGPLKAYLDGRGVAYRAFWIVNVLEVEGDRALALDLAARADVDRLSPNPRVKVPLPTEEQLSANDAQLRGAVAEAAARLAAESADAVEWGIQNTNAPGVWALGYDGTGIVVGGEDTGYRWTHEALKPKYRGWNGITADHNYNWHDAIHSGGGSCGANTTAPCDDYGHGTHTMGTMVGGDGSGPSPNDVGMAYGAKWIGCRNMDVGNGTPATYIECHQFMLAPTDLTGANPDPTKAPHVINNSWGCPPSEGCTDVNILHASIQALTNAGIVYVASAGNAGWNCSTVQDPPAIYDVSFSVAAHDSSNTLASFSSRGPVTVDGSNRRKPDVSAPGVGVRSSTDSSDTSYGSMSGTSMAGPHVAGAVALLLSARPALIGQVQQVINAFESTANPAVNNTGGAPNTCGGIAIGTIPNNHFGYGRIDVLAAVNSISLATPTPTPTGTLPTPTNTPTPTMTRTPTATPCYAPNPVTNPGFESGAFAPWVIDSATPPPAVVSVTAHTGTYAAQLGTLSGSTEPAGDASFYQTVTVPAAGGTLSFWYWPYTTDTITFDWQDAYVTDASGNILATVMHVAASDQMWIEKTFNMAAYAGQTVRLKFLVHQDGYGDVTGMYVDDVALLIPGQCGTATATPTATATGTATPTATATPALTERVWVPAVFDNAAP